MSNARDKIAECLAKLAREEPNIPALWAEATAKRPEPVGALVRLACIVPVHNRRCYTIVALASLLHAIPPDVEARVIVVDDGSSDDSRDEIKLCFPQVVIIQGDGTLYYSEGINVGLRSALLWSADYVLFFNNDQIFQWQSIGQLLSCAQRMAVVGGLLLRWNRPTEVFQVAQRWNTWFGGHQQYYGLLIDDFPEEPIPVDALSGNCVLAPIAAVRRAGLMDSRRLPMFGDTEYFRRMQRAGWPLLVEPRARVWCEPNRVFPLRGQRPATLFRQLFLERMHYNNLTHNFKRVFFSAPTRWLGFWGALVFFGRLALKAVGIGGCWPNWRNPPIYWQRPLPPCL